MFRLNSIFIRPSLKPWGTLRPRLPLLRFQSTTTKKPTGIKALMKEYGYSALGVYLALSAIDLPICYILVHSSGRDKIEEYENKLKNIFGYGVSEEELKQKQQERGELDAQKMDEQGQDSSSKSDGKPSLWQTVVDQFSWTEFAIAYGIHKSLIFIRAPITAAITPSVVKILRGWGFQIGTASLSTTATLAKDRMVDGAKKFSDPAALNPKFGTRPGKRKWWWFF